MSLDCHPIFGRWTAADIEMKQIVIMGDRWLLFSGADPGIFVGRGVQPSKKIKKQKRKKKTKQKTHKHTQKGRAMALQYITIRRPRVFVKGLK